MFLFLNLFILQVFAFNTLEVKEVRKTYLPYEEFCVNNQDECDLENSKEIVKFSKDLLKKLRIINDKVNKEIKFMLDESNYDQEEKWSLPLNGRGDCEDNALFKRKLLVEEFNIPRGSLRMTTAFHNEKFYAHALLAVNTSKGIYILDQDQEDVLKLEKTSYIYEAMELPGRRWARFFQEW